MGGASQTFPVFSVDISDSTSYIRFIETNTVNQMYSSSLIFSRSSAARILKVATDSIVKFQIWFRVCWVWVKGQSPKFISMRTFREHFVAWRKEQSELHIAYKVNSKQYTVVNKQNMKKHYLSVEKTAIVCDCIDYQNQTKTLGKGCCKHAYAVLADLGYNRLSDYINA
jgi:hypothetical protein